MIRKLSLIALLLLATPLAAQIPDTTPAPAPPPVGEELVDRVIAVVGDTSLLLSDLRTAVQQVQATTGQAIPEDPVQRDAFMTEVLDERINTLLLVEAARDAGVVVEDQAVTRAVEEQIAGILRNFGGSQQRLEAALAADGMTMTQYREVLTQQLRDDQLMRGFMAERMRARARPVISEDEIRTAFEAQRERLGTRPATVSFRQVIIAPEASDSADAEARRIAEEVYRELDAGGDWEVLARRFSDDPGSREEGGDLGWVRQGGGLIPEFERVAFAMRPGTLSPIFRTDFGYHILEVRRTQGAERQVRHILIQPEVTEADVERARVRADSVAEAVRGGANISLLARSYGTPEDQIEVEPQLVSNLRPDYGEPLATAQTGSVVGPFKVEGAGSENWVVVSVTLREEERPYTLQDVRDQLLVQLQEARMIDQIVEDLRSSIYVGVRM
jgi:peptidyl-prolyl cis-trans isomerase SurA